MQSTSVPTTCFQVLPDGSSSASPYIVPAPQRFVISTISINVNGVVSPVLIEQSTGNPAGRAIWRLTAAGIYQFQYPSGIVIAPGFSVSVVFDNTEGIDAMLYGYLTSN